MKNGDVVIDIQGFKVEFEGHIAGNVSSFKINFSGGYALFRGTVEELLTHMANMVKVNNEHAMQFGGDII